MLDGAGGAAIVAVRAVQLLAIITAAGAMAFEWWLLRRARDIDDWRAFLSARAARLGFQACVLLVLVAPMRLYLQAIGLVEPGAPVWPMVRNVLSVRWGQAWMAHVALALAGAMLLGGAARQGARARAVAMLVVAALCATPALTGHANGAAHARSVAIAGDWLHVCAGGAWVGALALLAHTARRHQDDPRGGAMVAALIEAFHPLALAAACTLAATGVLSLWLRIEAFRSLTGTPYGTLLFTKLGCVFAVAGLGAFHARCGATHARLSGPRAITSSLQAEVVFAVLAIGVTAMLTGTAPPEQ